MSAPDYLSPLAKQIYADTAKGFPTLEDGDPELLTSYAQAAALVEEMQRKINEQGLTLPNSRGNPSAHPLLNTLRGMMREKTSLAERIRKKHRPGEKAENTFA